MTQPLTVSFAPSQLSQVINPWSWTVGDFSLFTVNLGQSAAPQVETRVLDEVGSYGRQLGRIGDALRVIMSRTDLKAPVARRTGGDRCADPAARPCRRVET